MNIAVPVAAESMEVQGASGWRPRLRTLGIFALGGLVWWGLQGVLAHPDLPEVVVTVPAGADDEAIARAIDEAVLFEAGLELGWRTDPLVRDRLMRAMASMTPSDVPFLDRAEALGLHRRDPLVRARLVERARRLLPGPATPPEDLLVAWYAAQGQRFARPPVVHYQQRFAVDATRADRMWLQVQQQLPAAANDGDIDIDAGEPELQLGPRGVKPAPALLRVLGEVAVKQLLSAPPGTWVRARSEAGHHLVRAIAIDAPVVPPLGAIRAEVVAAWRAEQAPKSEAQALATLRAKFQVQVMRTPADADAAQAGDR